MGERGLTPKQRQFVREYVVDFNATQAAIRAGYGVDNASHLGPKLVRKSHVLAAIREEEEVLATRTRIRQDDVLRELALLAFSDIDNYTIGEGRNKSRLSLRPDADPGAKRAVSSMERTVVTRGKGDDKREEVKIKVSLWNKTNALKMLGEHLGLLKPTDLPALEILLAALPAEIGAVVRKALADAVIRGNAEPPVPAPVQPESDIGSGEDGSGGSSAD